MDSMGSMSSYSSMNSDMSFAPSDPDIPSAHLA